MRLDSFMGEIGGVMSEHYVYFITSRAKGRCMPVKIGYSTDPDTRVAKLQTGNPNKLQVCLRLKCRDEADGRRLERTLHKLAHKRFQSLEGEWFIIKGSWKKLLEQALKACRVELI